MDRTIEPHLEIAGLKKFVDGNVLVPDKEDVELWLDFCAAHLLTFMVISRDANMRGKSGGGGGWKSSNAKSTEGADHGKSAKGDDRGGGGSHREGRRFYICDAPDHLSYDCPGRDESDDDRDANRRKGDGGRRRPDNQPRKEKQASNTSSTKDAESSGGNARGEEAWCSMVGVVEMTISLALEVGEDSKAVAAAVHDNPSIVGTVALQGEARKQVLVPDVLYIPGVHANLLSAGQLKENGVKIQDDGGEMLLMSSAGDKSDVLVAFEKWLKAVERQTSKTVKMLRSDRGGEFLGRAFTDLVEDKGILHNLTCPYTLQQNGMAEREMRTVVEAVRMMLLHMGVKHQWWHLALRQAFWYMVLEQRRGGKLAPKAHWGLHLGVSAESKGWEVLDLTDNKVVTTVEAIFYETLSMEIWKVEYGSASTRTPSTPPTNSSSVHPPLLVADDELDEDDTDDVTPSPPPLFQGSSSAAGDEGRLGASPAAPTSCIASGQRDA
ncbi:unnamed protein product [Closterium sp. NIES-54]